MSLISTADFQFSLEAPLDGRLFTRRKDLTNNIRLLIGSNSEHCAKNDWRPYVLYLGCKIPSPFIIRSYFNIQHQF